MIKSKIEKAIFITGASSGIGAALAMEYAASGIALGLAARRLDKLEVIAERCRSRGALVVVYQLDVTDDSKVKKVADDFVEKAGRIDIVIANAGIGGWNHPVGAGSKTMTKMVDVNLSGVVNTLGSFLPQMEKQKSGWIVAISSIASFKGLPGGVYSATKAAVRYLMNGWRIDLAQLGIGVSTVYPGFVESEMVSADKHWYPFLISAEKAAKKIKSAIDRGRKNYIFPWQWNFIIPVLKFIPGSWLKRV